MSIKVDPINALNKEIKVLKEEISEIKLTDIDQIRDIGEKFINIFGRFVLFDVDYNVGDADVISEGIREARSNIYEFSLDFLSKTSKEFDVLQNQITVIQKEDKSGIFGGDIIERCRNIVKRFYGVQRYHLFLDVVKNKIWGISSDREYKKIVTMENEIHRLFENISNRLCEFVGILPLLNNEYEIATISYK